MLTNVEGLIKGESMKAREIIKNVKKFAKQNSSQLLTASSISASLAAVISAAKRRPKYDELRKEKLVDIRNRYGENEELTLSEEAEVFVKAFWPTGLIFIGSAVSSVASCKEGLKKTAAAVAVSEVLQNRLDDIDKAITKTVGEKAHNDIVETKSRDAADRELNNIRNGEKPYNTGHGNMLFIDASLGGSFYASPEWVKEARNELNSRINLMRTCTANDWFECLGRKPIGYGDQFIFVQDDEYNNMLFTYDAKYYPDPETGEIYGVLNYDNEFIAVGI